MQGHYHAVVWIDSREAKVFHFNGEDVEKVVIHAHKHEAAYLEEVTKAFSDAHAVLVTGPGLEKKALLKHIAHKHPTLSDHIEAVETDDHPSDGELIAHARKALAAKDRMRPQIELSALRRE